MLLRKVPHLLPSRTRTQRVALLMALAGVPFSAVEAQNTGTPFEVADSFQLTGNRQAGNELKGSSTEIGNSPWKVIGAAILREDGALTVGNEKGATAWVPLTPQLTQVPFKAQLWCQPATTDWIALSLGGELSDFFKTAKISLNLRPSGTYALFVGNGAEMWSKPLAQGKANKFDGTGWNTLEIEFDAQKSRLSASINGEKVVINQNIEAALGGAKIGFAGFRFNETSGNRPATQAKVPAVDNFALIPLAEAKPVAPAQPVATQAQTLPDGLEPLSRTQFFLQPNEQTTLKWRVPKALNKAAYRVTDYQNRVVASQTVEARQVDNNISEIQLPLNLPAGFYQVEFPEQKQNFGVVALPAYQGAFDKFFAIDSALSWLETRPAMRAELLASLKRSGIGVARERLSWGAVNPKEGEWDFETSRQFDTLRKEYTRNGLQLLDVFHSAPAWTQLDTKNPYPQRLAATKESWQTMGKHWGETWQALEVWNEPDLDFGGEIPASQYLPTVKTINYALRESQMPTLVGGGVFGYFTPTYIRDAIRNGLLDQVDFVSFHTYAKAPSLEQIIIDYRGALTVQGQRPVPLWLTESGQAWTSGQPRPEIGQDKTSALDIAMKAVEARACGIASYFAFVYPYYVEGKNNFGMMGQEVTPLRSMAAYTQAVKALSHTKYIGDLNIVGAERARVFAKGDEAVVVIYNEKTELDTSVSWAGALTRLEGIDGRVLAKSTSGKIPLADGLTYAYTPLKTLQGLSRQTAATKLYEAAQNSRTQRPAASALVLQALPPTNAQSTKRGYRLDNNTLASFPFRVRVSNLSKTSSQVRLRPTVDGTKGITIPERQVEVGALGTVEVQWDVDLASAFQQVNNDSLTLSLSGTDGNGMTVSPLSLDVFSSRNLETYLKLYTLSSKIDLTDLTRWTHKIGPTGQIKLSTNEGKIWQLQSNFKGGDRWVYPEFQLPKTMSLEESAGLLIRARVTSPATARLMIKERSGATYFTPFSFIPTDGQWHTAMLQWADLAALPSGAPDANGRLDFDQIESLALGLNSKTDENTLEVSDLYVARKPK